MTIKVGDMVRCLVDEAYVTKGGEYHVKEESSGCVLIFGDDGRYIWLLSDAYEPITATHTTISAAIRERMEYHMSKGEYVRAVKWAELAEKAEEIDNDTAAN